MVVNLHKFKTSFNIFGSHQMLQLNDLRVTIQRKDWAQVELRRRFKLCFGQTKIRKGWHKLKLNAIWLALSGIAKLYVLPYSICRTDLITIYSFVNVDDHKINSLRVIVPYSIELPIRFYTHILALPNCSFASSIFLGESRSTQLNLSHFMLKTYHATICNHKGWLQITINQLVVLSKTLISL